MNQNLNRSLLAAAAGLCSLFAIGTASAQPSGGVTGACCVRTNTGIVCRVATAMQCRNAQGVFRGPGTTCDPNPCVPPPPPPPPTGACCNADADGNITCAVVTGRECFDAGGRFRGPDTTCEPNPCIPPPPPSGACCTIDADGNIACNVGLATDCRDAGGHFRGPDTVCDPNPCLPPPPPTGACCTVDDAGAGVCAVMTAIDCRTAGGRFRGPNTSCEPNRCPSAPPVRGACCIPGTDRVGPHCVIITAANCQTAGGVYGGDNSTCASANCPTTCACDWDHDGFLSLRDLFSFLQSYMGGSADFNGDGVTNDADLMEFFACFQSAPTGCTRPGAGGPP